VLRTSQLEGRNLTRTGDHAPALPMPPVSFCAWTFTKAFTEISADCWVSWAL